MTLLILGILVKSGGPPPQPTVAYAMTLLASPTARSNVAAASARTEQGNASAQSEVVSATSRPPGI